MIKRFLKLFSVFTAITSLFFFHAYAAAAFPISNLGNCSSREECKIFCDDTLHIKVCTEYAAKSGLISNRAADVAKHFADTIVSGRGPGGCRTKNECIAYCGILNHLQECQIFAVKINSTHSATSSPASVPTQAPVVRTQASSAGQIPPPKNPIPKYMPPILEPHAPVMQDQELRSLQGPQGIKSESPEFFIENRDVRRPLPPPSPAEHSQEFQSCKLEIVGSIDGPMSPSDSQAIADCIKSENALPDPDEVGQGISDVLIANILEATGEFRVFFNDVSKTLTHMFLFR
ncbi:hypothetical protein KW783_01915 [Candidatus Parcubacteria bacterium]|nr:hypothetical protein [Candidatus Parcubacteria bacterium]